MPCRISMVSASDGSSTNTGWKRRSSAASFSMYLRYSLSVVAPMHWISPRASAGLRMFAASIAPSAAPAPTSVCNSSMKRITSREARISSRIFLRRSSNSPRYLVPATSAPMSSVSTRLPISDSGMLPRMICCASPSAMAVLPTPGSPMSAGLFLVRRLRICTTRSISIARPITGSSEFLMARSVRSRQNWSSSGVLEGFFCASFDSSSIPDSWRAPPAGEVCWRATDPPGWAVSAYRPDPDTGSELQRHRPDCRRPPASFLPPARRGFPLTLGHAIAVAFNDGHFGMMQQTIQQRDDAGGVGEDLVPFLEGAICGEDHRLAFVTPVDDFVEQVRRLVVKREIAYLVDSQKTNIGVCAQFTAAAFGCLSV